MRPGMGGPHGGDGAHLATTSASPDPRLHAEDLGATYRGGASFNQLARAGRVEELAPNAVARADALFRTPAAPWTPDAF